jgi:glycosyltransferase involved in cell wall biosynthesis
MPGASDAPCPERRLTAPPERIRQMMHDHPFRVAYILKRYPRFSETFIVHELLAHERAGLDVEVFALRPVDETHFQDILGRVRAPVSRIPEKTRDARVLWSLMSEARGRLPGFGATLDADPDVDLDDLAQSIRVALMAQERGITHLHAHFGTVATTVARLASRMLGITYTFTAHAKDIYHRYDEPVRIDRKLRDAAATVTISDYNARHLRGSFGPLADRVSVVRNGLDLSTLPWSGHASTSREILAVGRLVEKKGFHVLIEAARVLHERGHVFTCRIIGAGPERAHLEDQILRSGLAGVVRLEGPRPQSEVVAAMRGCSMLAAPCVVGEDGNRDGLPTVLLEAMAVGAPCIATDVTGIPELVTDGETGLMAPEGDPDALADGLARLLKDDGLRSRLSHAARRRIETEYDIDRNTRQLRALFREVATRPERLMGAA